MHLWGGEVVAVQILQAAFGLALLLGDAASKRNALHEGQAAWGLGFGLVLARFLRDDTPDGGLFRAERRGVARSRRARPPGAGEGARRGWRQGPDPRPPRPGRSDAG